MAELISSEHWINLHQELLSCPWFEKLGNPDLRQVHKEYRYVNSWPETIPWATCEYSWISIGIARYRIQSNISQSQLNQWNILGKLAIPFVETILHDLVKPRLKAKFHGMTDTEETLILKWVNVCIGLAYIELAYSKVVHFNFFRPLIDIYMQGHFPCGWTADDSGWTADENGDDENFPNNAQLVVY